MQPRRGDALLKGALAALALAAGLLCSPSLVRDVYATDPTCGVKCNDGSSCIAIAGENERCTCTCSVWGTGSAVCTCKSLKPVVDG
ncbi:MAG TPA: hypothetical protein VHG28_25195 [Longimicrobiaceae bacterium]|nr:hypothetical protein [Longimicrobiaceae bacterium]